MRAAGTLICLIVLAVVMTWPLLPNLERAATDPADPYLVTFVLDWVSYQLIRNPLRIFDAPIFHPAQKALAFSEHLIGLAIVALPLRLAGIAPLTVYNILFLAGFVASGMGAYVLTRHITRSDAAAFVAATMYAFVPYRMGQASHLQHVWSVWLPLSLWALLRLREAPTLARAAVFTGTVVMLGLSNVHWLLFGGLALTIAIAILARKHARFVAHAAAALVIAAVVLLPTLLPYRWVAKQYGMVRSAEETMHYSATPRDWAIAPLYNKTYESARIEHDGELRLFPGIVLTLCALAGIILAKRNAPLIVIASWVVLGVIGSFGLHFLFHRLLYEHVEVFRAIRVPARWAMISYTGLAVLAGMAMTRARIAVIAVVCAAFLWEARTFPIRWHLRGTDNAAVYAWLNTLPPGGAVLELPLRYMSNDYEAMLAQHTHRRPLVNGASGFEPPFYPAFAALPENLLDELEKTNVKLLVIHADRLGDREEATIRMLQNGVATGRLRFIDRFVHDHRGDFVFSIPPRTRLADDTDRALARGARAPEDALTALNARRFMQTDAVVGILDHPQVRADIHGPLLVSGWALSPHGVRDVYVLMNNGRLRYRARLVPHDLTSAYPHLRSHMSRAGFRLEFAGKPRSIWSEADLQIEIVDYTNRVHRLPQIWFQWSDDSPSKE